MWISMIDLDFYWLELLAHFNRGKLDNPFFNRGKLDNPLSPENSQICDLEGAYCAGWKNCAVTVDA